LGIIGLNTQRARRSAATLGFGVEHLWCYERWAAIGQKAEVIFESEILERVLKISFSSM
jgi:hypothetical protein